MPIKAISYEQSFVDQLRHAGVDAYGNAPERQISDGGGNPCRSCLHDIPKGEEMLVVSACPFPEPQPYAETGPVFFCADDCTPWQGAGLPPVLNGRADALIKGYGADHRILYGTGDIVPVPQIAATCETLFDTPDVAFIDLRSSKNNCFTFRILRDSSSDNTPQRLR